MNAVEIVLVLLASSVVLAIVAERAKIPFPAVLVIGGIVIAFVPGAPVVQIPSDLVLVIFLPPLVYGAAWLTSWLDFRAHVRTIGLLAIGLVLATTIGVAAVAHALVPGLPWSVAFVLGAIVSPPDAVAATAVFRRLHVPAKIVTVLEGESLVNDATGLVAYQVALGAVMTGGFSASEAVVRFAVTGLGGVAFGLAVGWIVARVHRRLDDFVIETVISLLTPYVAYIPAEHFGVSGVLSTVVAGGYLGWRNPQLLSPLTRLRSRTVWTVLLFLFNSLVFVLIGLELAATSNLFATLSHSLWGMVVICLAIAGTAIGIRIVWVPVATYVPYWLGRLIRHRAPTPRWKETAVIAWTSMRGIVSLALVLALPRTLPDGSPFPHRNVVVVLVFSVIVVTLLGQGLTLPLVIRALGFADEGTALKQEREGLLRGTERALARLDELDRTSIIVPWLVDRLRAVYTQRLSRLQANLGDDPECRLTEGENEAYRRLRQQLIDAERSAMVELRNRGEISEDVLYALQLDLDFEALQPLR